jgi:DNA-binding ferritin-like protein
MKTAVDYIAEMASELGYVPSEFYAKAKELEKLQIIKAYEAAMERPIENYAEAYYNMNYNQDIKYTFENIDLGKGNNNNNLISTSNKKTEWVKNVQNNLTIYQSKLNK